QRVVPRSARVAAAGDKWLEVLVAGAADGDEVCPRCQGLVQGRRASLAAVGLGQQAVAQGIVEIVEIEGVVVVQAEYGPEPATLGRCRQGKVRRPGQGEGVPIDIGGPG